MAWSYSLTSAKQTAYNVAAQMVSALATAGLLESAEQANTTLEEVAGKVFNELNAVAEKEGAQVTAEREADPRINYDSPGEVTFNFGRHDGETIAAVYESDPDYIDWLVNKDYNKARNKIRKPAKEFLDKVQAGV